VYNPQICYTDQYYAHGFSQNSVLQFCLTSIWTEPHLIIFQFILYILY